MFIYISIYRERDLWSFLLGSQAIHFKDLDFKKVHFKKFDFGSLGHVPFRCLSNTVRATEKDTLNSKSRPYIKWQLLLLSGRFDFLTFN